MRNFLIVITACILAVPTYSQKKIDKQYYIGLLQNGSYSRVFDECMNMRNGVYGKCAILDYFIAKSLCLDGYQQKSREWLKYMLDNYPLKDATRKFISNDISNCSVSSATSSLGTILTLPLPQASVSGTTKMGPIVNCANKNQLINWEKLFDENDLQSRLFAEDQKQEALSKFQSLLGNKYKVDISGHFIVITQAIQNISSTQVEKVTTGLQHAFDFYKRFYNLRTPDKLLTVYLMPNQKSLQEVAFKIHGIAVGNATLGYSLLSDLSLLGIADPDHIGTLYHELFHLVIRTDAGDIPAWLDEGLASLYSVYYWDKDTLKGSPATWRITQLNAHYLETTNTDLPGLKQLVSYSWQQFNGGEEINLCRASVNYALANHFMIYLQEKELLQSLVYRFKSRNTPGNKNDSAAKDNITIVENVCNAPIEKIQTDFESWFNKKYSFNLYAHNSPDSHRMEYDYMMFEELQGKISDMLYSMQSKVQKQDDSAFIDSAKTALKTINEKFKTLEQSYTSYKNAAKMEEFNMMAENLKKDLFDLYNRVEDFTRQ